MPAVHLKVLGRVQGVGFRWFIRVHGRRLGLSGWVMNQPDGTVEIAAEGAQEKLDDLKRMAARGPEGAAVSEVKELPPPDAALDFPFGVRKR